MREQSAGTIAGAQSGRAAGICSPRPLFRRFSETRGKAAARKNRASGKSRCGGRARCARISGTCIRGPRRRQGTAAPSLLDRGAEAEAVTHQEIADRLLRRIDEVEELHIRGRDRLFLNQHVLEPVQQPAPEILADQDHRNPVDLARSGSWSELRRARRACRSRPGTR